MLHSKIDKYGTQNVSLDEEIPFHYKVKHHFQVVAKPVSFDFDLKINSNRF